MTFEIGPCYGMLMNKAKMCQCYELYRTNASGERTELIGRFETFTEAEDCARFLFNQSPVKLTF